MIVPPTLRQAVGKREIKESLHTVSLSEARLLCSAKQVERNDRFNQLREKMAGAAAADGVRIVDKTLDLRIEEHGSFRAIAYELELIAQAETAYLDDPEMLEAGQSATDLCPAYAVYTDPRSRELISARHRALHRDAMTAPLTGAEAASRAQNTVFWQVASAFLEDAFEAAGLPMDGADARVRVAADHFLSRLLSHKLPQLDIAAAAHPMPPGLRPYSIVPNVVATKPPPPVSTPKLPPFESSIPEQTDAGLRRLVMGEHADARTILQVFAARAGSRGPRDAKLIDEWRTTINRFVGFLGDLDVTLITDDQVALFREAMIAFPTRPKATVRYLPLREQIAIARRDQLATLSGPTVAK